MIHPDNCRERFSVRSTHAATGRVTTSRSTGGWAAPMHNRALPSATGPAPATVRLYRDEADVWQARLTPSTLASCGLTRRDSELHRGPSYNGLEQLWRRKTAWPTATLPAACRSRIFPQALRVTQRFRRCGRVAVHRSVATGTWSDSVWIYALVSPLTDIDNYEYITISLSGLEMMILPKNAATLCENGGSFTL